MLAHYWIKCEHWIVNPCWVIPTKMLVCSNPWLFNNNPTIGCVHILPNNGLKITQQVGFLLTPKTNIILHKTCRVYCSKVAYNAKLQRSFFLT